VFEISEITLMARRHINEVNCALSKQSACGVQFTRNLPRRPMKPKIIRLVTRSMKTEQKQIHWCSPTSYFFQF